MDSKIRRMAIFASMGVILLVTLLVMYTNGDTDGGGTPGRPRRPGRKTRRSPQAASRVRDRTAW